MWSYPNSDPGIQQIQNISLKIKDSDLFFLRGLAEESGINPGSESETGPSHTVSKILAVTP